MRARLGELRGGACVAALFVIVGCGPKADDGSSAGGSSEGSTDSVSTTSASMTGRTSTSADATGGGSSACAPWLTECRGECVDTKTDPNHCGDCSTACGELVCAAGRCQADCGNLTACGQSCVDLQTDQQHCGACDTPCDADELCSDSECDLFAPTSCDECPCPECEDNCCAIGSTVVCAMGECPPP